MDKKNIHRTAIIFLLADVLYSQLFELTGSLARQGKELKRDTKMRFNQAMTDLNRAKKSCLRASEDVDIKMMDAYIDDSDFLSSVVELVYEKTLHNDKNQDVIINFLKDLKND